MNHNMTNVPQGKLLLLTAYLLYAQINNTLLDAHQRHKVQAVLLLAAVLQANRLPTPNNVMVMAVMVTCFKASVLGNGLALGDIEPLKEGLSFN